MIGNFETDQVMKLGHDDLISIYTKTPQTTIDAINGLVRDIDFLRKDANHLSSAQRNIAIKKYESLLDSLRFLYVNELSKGL